MSLTFSLGFFLDFNAVWLDTITLYRRLRLRQFLLSGLIRKEGNEGVWTLMEIDDPLFFFADYVLVFIKYNK